jgi:prolipoprotein diacylglyceryltransferase
MYPFLTLGPLRLPSYGVALAFALAAGILWTSRRAAQWGMPRQQVFGIASLAALAAVIGGRIPVGLPLDRSGVFLVGFLCGVAVFWLGARLAQIDFWRLCDAAAAPVALGVAVVRLGCFGAGCDYGAPTASFFGVVFSNLEAHARTGIPLGVRLHPTQLYESLLGAALLTGLLAIDWRRRPAGSPCWFFIGGYSAGRFLIEFLRGDAQRGFWGPLSTSQWLAMVVVVLFAALRATNLRRAAPLALFLAATLPASAQPPVPSPDLVAGFRRLYELSFEEGIRRFHTFQKEHPADPLGYTAEAAGVAFHEFHRLELLMSQNFLGPRPLLDGAHPKADPAKRRRLNEAVGQAQELARMRLKADPRHQDSMFALALTYGLEADYAYLVERRALAALRAAREAESWAKRLLALNPEYFDAHLAPGAANYILASLPGPQRFFLRLGGIRGSKAAGIAQLEIVAGQGVLLKPFAKILLALIAVRERSPARARQLLVELRQEFPANTLFPKELAMLQ